MSDTDDTLTALLDESIEAELRGAVFVLEDRLAVLSVEDLDELRRKCEAEDGYDDILDAVEAEIGARMIELDPDRLRDDRDERRRIA